MTKKLILSFLLGLLIGTVGSSSRVEARGLGSVWNQTTVVLSSQVIFTGGGELYKIHLGTGNGLTDWCQAIDTQLVNLTGYQAFISTQMVTPPLVFFSSTTAGIEQGANSWGVGTGETVIIKNGLFLWKSNAAPQATIYWRKD